MAIINIIQKAEQEFSPAIKQELDPVARPELALLSGYVDTAVSGFQSQINNRVTNLGAASGIQVMTTGAYNSGTPLSGVVYILI
jgi:hypothetical protein